MTISVLVSLPCEVCHVNACDPGDILCTKCKAKYRRKPLATSLGDLIQASRGKAHDEYKGVKQTKLSHCSVILPSVKD